jgi:hypothetical protein
VYRSSYGVPNGVAILRWGFAPKVALSEEFWFKIGDYAAVRTIGLPFVMTIVCA